MPTKTARRTTASVVRITDPTFYPRKGSTLARKMMRAQALQEQIQALDEELRDLRTDFAVAFMQRPGVKFLQYGNFRAAARQRHNWKYSPELERELQKLTVDRLWEQRHGVAQDSPTSYVALSTIPQ